MMGDSLLHQALDVMTTEFGTQGTEVRAIGAPAQTLLTRQAEWMVGLRKALDEFKPDVVVLESCCGHYDARDPYVEKGVGLTVDSAELWAAWERTVDQAIRLARAHSSAVLWALAPASKTNGLYGPIEDRIARANGVVLRMTQRYPDLGLVDWGILTGPAGEFEKALPDTTGRMVEVRAADGFHFANAGQQVIAETTRDAVNDAWRAARARGTGPSRS
jgi:hypothetical protein